MTYLSLSGLARDCCSFIFEKKTTSWLIIIINYIKNKKSLWFGFVLVSFAAVVWARHATLPPPTGGGGSIAWWAHTTAPKETSFVCFTFIFYYFFYFFFVKKNENRKK